MNKTCESCKLDFEPEGGYYLGSVYFNYFVTSLLVTFIFFGLYFGAGIRPNRMIAPLAVFCLLFPLWFFRYARALWRGFDELFDPGQNRTDRSGETVTKTPPTDRSVS